VHSAAVPPVTRDLLIGTAIVWAMVEVRQSLRHRRGAAPASWASEIVFRIAVAGAVIAALLVRRNVPATSIRAADVAAWTGLGLFWCGITLRAWSFVTLGRYFTVVVQTSSDQPVITSGPYRVIRHPSYAGIILAVTGGGLFTLNWLSLAILAGGVTGALVYRIRVEDRALLANLGEPYRAYAATHKRLIPFIW
jgi:protein-S-isoprenylcysteine O-methyltransferase Ste14